MKFDKDERVVMTLDAGGTNFVFSAIQANIEIIDPICLPSNANNLHLCLNTIVDGFSQIKSKIKKEPVAISFAFPGPADYPNGIIGDLVNLPAFRGGIALGPMLKEKFNIPVFINNDGDLFAYGEAIAGLLPHLNQQIKEAGIDKQYHNLFGITLGTGFGAGLVRKGELYIGDNSAGAEIWALRNKLYNTKSVEESVSIRGIMNVYKTHSKAKNEKDLSPKDIYNIACGQKEGDKKAAVKAFQEMGEVIGDALANATTLLDSIVVIGGGLSGAHSVFLPEIIKEMNSSFKSMDGKDVSRFELKAYNLVDPDEFKSFIIGKLKEINIPGSDKKVMYDPLKRIGVGISKLGTCHAVAIGSYSFALMSLDKK